MKKILIFILVVSYLSLLTGCGKEKNKNEISYTNKYECSTKTNFTKLKYDYSKRNISVTPAGEDTSPQAVESITSRIYDFNEDGSKVLAYYIVREYKYLIDYNMEEEKAYFNKQCDSINENVYKSCNVSLKNKTITVTIKVNIDSESNKEHYSKLTLDSIKESFANDVAYTCK